MKKARVIAVIIFFVFSSAWFIQAAVLSASQKAIESKSAQKGLQKAKELFSKHCARCHGEDGKAETQEGLDLG
ncbi:MAG: c-type cytochrome, partial [Pyrinomonadaceae bacterium]